MSAAMAGLAKTVTAATPNISLFIGVPFMRWHPSKQRGPNLVAGWQCRSRDRSRLRPHGNSPLLFPTVLIFRQSRTVLRFDLSNRVVGRFRPLVKLKLFGRRL